MTTFCLYGVEYAPYGTPDTPLTSTDIHFTGEFRDATTGLQFHRARYYDPSLGVFPSLDPFEGLHSRPMSLNGYSWVEGNPVMNTDASGLTSLCAGVPVDYWQFCMDSILAEGKTNRPQDEYCQLNCYANILRPGLATANQAQAGIVWQQYNECVSNCMTGSSWLDGLGMNIEGYIKGEAGSLTISGYNGQVGAEIVYNFKTFQRLFFTYKGTGGYASLAGISGAAYIGHVEGFKSLTGAEESGEIYNQFLDQYTGEFMFSTASLSTPILKLGVGAVHFHSPSGAPDPVYGNSVFLSRGVGLELPVQAGLGRLWYDADLDFGKKSYIKECKVDTSELVKDIIIGTASPLGVLGGFGFGFAALPARLVAAQAAKFRGDKHNRLQIDPCKCQFN